MRTNVMTSLFQNYMSEEKAMTTAHIDTFTQSHLPPEFAQPEFLLDLPELQLPEVLNCATELLDNWVTRGEGSRTCLIAPGGLRWTYGDVQDRANRIANVLVDEMGLVPGNRVLLRAPNNPMLVACWFAVMKAGGVAVPTMPLLRAKELRQVISKAKVSHALCDWSLRDELEAAKEDDLVVREVRYFNSASPQGLEAEMRNRSAEFTNVATAATDTCILAFTSGTTGAPKATMHFHRDVMAVCACWPKHVLRLLGSDVVIGSPPLAFTFGLGGLTLFPMSVGASTVLLEKAGPKELLEAIPRYSATVLFTAPTSYRAMATQAGAHAISKALGGPLRKCVSAGEALSAATRALWRQHTGIELIDGLGATEMLHIFISADEESSRPGATGLVVPGYEACVMDSKGIPVPPGTVGKLAVKGPTGCRYLDDTRQGTYVSAGWNYTGDAYVMDADGYFYYQSRTDDMIISAGYNIAATDVEDALMLHPAVAECAVVAVPDPERGEIVKAFVVVRSGAQTDDGLARELQDFVKASIAPYKYPRAIEFRTELPRTSTGKLQRFQLRAGAAKLNQEDAQ